MRENKIRIHRRTYNILFIISDNKFSNFLKISENCGLKIHRRLSEAHMNISEDFLRCPKTTEGCLVFASKLRKYFDHIDMNTFRFVRQLKGPNLVGV